MYEVHIVLEEKKVLIFFSLVAGIFVVCVGVCFCGCYSVVLGCVKKKIDSLFIGCQILGSLVHCND